MKLPYARHAKRQVSLALVTVYFFTLIQLSQYATTAAKNPMIILMYKPFKWELSGSAILSKNGKIERCNICKSDTAITNHLNYDEVESIIWFYTEQMSNNRNTS